MVERIRLDEERGQTLPLLMVLVVAVIAAGLALFQVGRAADSRSQAQIGADAAVLAGARAIGEQLTGLYDSAAGIDEAAVEEAAADYAERNGAELTSFDVRGLDVLVTVRTEEALGEDAERVRSAGVRGTARARARVEPPAMGVGGVPTGNLSGSIRDAIALGASMGLVVTSGLRPGDTGSLHSLGIAVDMAGSPQQMAAFYMAALKRYRYIEELFYDPLGGIDKNVSIGAIGGHVDHVHIALLGESISSRDTSGEADAKLPHDPHAVTPGAYGSPEFRLVPWDG